MSQLFNDVEVDQLITTMNYVHPVENLFYDQRHMGPGEQELVTELDKQRVHIENARKSEHDFSLDINGFELLDTNFTFRNFSNNKEVIQILYPEILSFLKKVTGASDGLLFDHTVRSTKGQENTTFRRAPVKTVHNDYTDKSAHERLSIELEKLNKENWTKRHFKFVNIWMPIYHTVEESPLAIGDVSTFAPNDFHKLKLIYPDREGEILAFSYSAAHQWYYFPKMNLNEALLLKVYDSNESTLVKYVPHSAFVDPTSPNDVKPRTSIEIRSILFF